MDWLAMAIALLAVAGRRQETFALPHLSVVL